MAHQPSHRELIQIAYDEPRRASATQPTVCLYLRSTLEMLVETLEAAQLGPRATELHRQARLVAVGCGKTVPARRGRRERPGVLRQQVRSLSLEAERLDDAKLDLMRARVTTDAARCGRRRRGCGGAHCRVPFVLGGRGAAALAGGVPQLVAESGLEVDWSNNGPTGGDGAVATDCGVRVVTVDEIDGELWVQWDNRRARVTPAVIDEIERCEPGPGEADVQGRTTETRAGPNDPSRATCSISTHLAFGLVRAARRSWTSCSAIVGATAWLCFDSTGPASTGRMVRFQVFRTQESRPRCCSRPTIAPSQKRVEVMALRNAIQRVRS